MNSNNPLFQLNNDFSSKLSTDGYFTPQSFSSGRCTPNSQISSCYDMPSIYGHSSVDDTLPFFGDENSALFENKYQQCTLNTVTRGFNSSLAKFDRGINKVASYIDGPFNKNNSQYYNPQLSKDDRKFQKGNNNRNRYSFNKENNDLSRALQGNAESFEYKK